MLLPRLSFSPAFSASSLLAVWEDEEQELWSVCSASSLPLPPHALPFVVLAMGYSPSQIAPEWAFPTGCGSSRVSAVQVLTLGCREFRNACTGVGPLQSHTCQKTPSCVGCSLLQGPSTCCNMGFLWGCRGICALPWTSTGCRGRAAPPWAVPYLALAPAAPPPAPSSLTLISAGLCSHIFSLFSHRCCCAAFFYHSLNMSLQRCHQHHGQA